jgi:hypothetical protein
MRRRTSVAIVFLAFAFAESWAANAREQQADADVIATERPALERWGKGDPDGFLNTYAPEVTYFAPTHERRIDGLAAMTAALSAVRGTIRIDRYENAEPESAAPW